MYGFVGNNPLSYADTLGLAYDPNDPTTWTLVDGVWFNGTAGNGRFMPAIGTGFSDLGTIEYKNGVPLLSKHPGALIDGQVHVVILEKWNGTGNNDSKRAARMLKAKLPDGDYVWHHEEIVDVAGKKGVKMVLVPRRLNSIPHAGPASWRRAAIRMEEKATGLLRPLTRCVVVLGVVSFVFDPGGAIASPFGGETMMGDATFDGYVQRQIDERIQNLQRVRDPQEYRRQLLELRGLYKPCKFLEHLQPLIDQQLKILDSVTPPAPPLRPIT